MPSSAVGLSGAFNLNPHFAIDADFLETPASSTGNNDAEGGRASEFLMGARAEVRGRHYGYYLKAQPGYFRWSNVITSATFPTPDTFVFSFGPLTHFAADVGAGVEYSPSTHLHFRAEVTDLIIRYSNSSWTHNLQPAAGIYVGVGKRLAWEPPIYNANVVHRFSNRTNIALITAGLLASTADAVTTQRFIKQGLPEGDPFARPLVKYGWSGQISLMSLQIGAEVVTMYSLHRMGQHWIERLLPACIATTNSVFAYKNSLVSRRKP